MKLLFFSLWLVISPTVTFAVPLSDFFDYNRVGSNCISNSNSSSANEELSRSDCDAILFPETLNHEILFIVNTTFPFFTETVTKIYSNVNGFLSFNEMIQERPYFPVPFPIPDLSIVAAFWNYIDIRRGGGDVILRPSTDPIQLNKASQEIRQHFVDINDFNATWIFIVSWKRVAYYSAGNLNNTFQIVLVTNKVHSFAIINYEDDGINWSSVEPGGSGNGSTGTAAQAGFSDRSEINHFLLPGSNTPDIINVSSTSNVEIRGKWIFRFTYPSFVIRPPFQLQQLGGDFILNCTPSDNTSEIGWLRNDDEIINNDRISYSPNDRLRHILIISNASSADAANYTCALNRSGTLINRLISKVDIFKDIVNIFNEASEQLVPNAIINNFGHIGSGGSANGAGIPIMLYFTCITVSGHENATWMSLINIGDANITYDDGIDYMSSVEVLISGENFTVLLSCFSSSSRQFSNITITSETPYIRVLGNSTILTTVGSRPVLDFTVAVDSNGVQEFQNDLSSFLSFTFTNSTHNQILLPLPVINPDNFQRYSYTLPPLGINTEGIYNLTIHVIQEAFASVAVRLDVPQISLVPPLVIQQFGSRITLNCTPSNSTIPVYWSRNGQPIVNATFLPNFRLKHVLVINNASLSDNGIYTCGLNMTGLPMNEKYGEIILYRDSINILNNGSDVENDSVINQFNNNGENLTVTLTCTTIDGLGEPIWTMLSESGNVVVLQKNMSYNTNALILSNPTSNLITRFTCRSQSNSSLYKVVLVTTANPYYNLLSTDSIFAPVASSPMIRIVIAINSDGTLDQQRRTTQSLIFTHTRNNVTMPIDGLEPDPLNFQLYQYTFPPLRRNSGGNYRIQSTIVVGNESLDVAIQVEVNITGLMLTRSFASIILLEGNTVTISCTPNITKAVLYWVYNDNGTNITESTGKISLSPRSINHNLTIINPVMSDSGIYSCRSVIEELIVQDRINVTIVEACKSDFSQALFWNISRRGVQAIQSCSELHSSFRFGVSISRQCQADGNWSPVDIRNCTMSTDSNPVIVVYFTTGQNNTVVPDNILNLIMANYEISNIQMRVFNHISNIGEEMLSTRVSFNLQESRAPVNIVDSITTILQSNDSNGGFQILAFQPSPNCTCDIRTEIDNTLHTICTGPSTAPCRCDENMCECNNSTFVGNGTICGLDSDSDGFPDVDLDCNELSCQRDLCPEIYSVIDGMQSDSFCIFSIDTLSDDTRCPFGNDTTWNITWPLTDVGVVAIQKCPGGSEAEGFARRTCISERIWGAPNVSECQTIEQIRLRMRAEELSDLINNVFESEDRDLTQAFEPEIIVDITSDLEAVTNTSQPILPNDVTSASETLNIVLLATEIASEEVDEAATMEVVMGAVSVLDSLFDERNDVSFQEMSVESQAMEQSAGELLLENTERVGVLFSTTVNASDNETVRSYLEGSNSNIIIEAQIPTEEDLMETGSVQFPPPAGNVDAMRFNNRTPNVQIPASIIIQRIAMEGRRIPIINSVSRNRNLPSGRSTIEGMILSSQISTSLDPLFFDDNQTVALTFNIESVTGNASLVQSCNFFNLTTGNFSDFGIVETGSNSTHIRCTSAHLTSFAVLVDASGVESVESEALSYITYIGCGISIICLAITIVLLIVFRKTIFNQVQHFVHINLALVLLLGLVTFVSGIEQANEYRESCLAVAVLLHYLFTSAFCWMLCEGILLYIILKFVFYNGFFKTRKFYFLIGWGLPIPIVAISAGIAHDHYGANNRCWISEEEGAIWAFIGPMLLIILTNTCFLIATLYRIYKSKRSNMTAEDITMFDTAKSLLKASFVLMPVLGITWVFGLLIINEDTVVFVWVFTVLNSLQGLFIMIFYVFRNEKFIKYMKSCGAGRTLFYSSSIKDGTLKTSSLHNNYVDRDTVKKSLSSYNRVIRENYVNPASCVSVESENTEQMFSPTNVFNVHGAADEFSFNELDELEHTTNPLRSDSVLEPISPLDYLKHQKQAVVGYVDVNIFAEEETRL